jgi:hypothetical protein
MPARALADYGHTVAIGHGGASLPREAGAIIPLTNDSKPLMHELPEIVVMQRVMDLEYVEAIPAARAAGQIVVQDLDDWLWGLDKRNKAWWGTHPDRNPTWNRDIYLRQIELSDAVTVSTRAIGELLRHRTGCRTPQILLRNVCDMPAYDVQTVRDTTEGLVVGWVGALGWRSGDLETLRGVLDPFLAACGGSFVHHGTFPAPARKLNGTVARGRFVRRTEPYRDEGTAAERAGIAPERTGPTDTFRKPWDYPELVRGFDIGVVPLSAQAFNYAKCLDFDMRVSTRRGILPIGEIVPGDQVWRDGRWRDVEAVRHETPTPGVEIVTDAGRVLRLTRDHRLMVDGTWTRAGAITAGQVVATTPDAPSEGALVRAPWPADGRRTRGGSAPDFTAAPDAPHVEVTARWGRILGLFAGDGCCTGKTSVSFACDGQDGDLIATLTDDLRAVGLAPTTEIVTTFGGAVLRRRNVRVASAHLTRFLVSLGMAEWRADGMKAKRVVAVPETIWRSPRGVVAAFLSGLFEADGSAYGAGLALSTVHLTFARDVQRLLAALGIEATVRPHHGANAWVVGLRRAAADVFAKDVGFLSARKQARLAVITAKPHSNAYRPQRWQETVAEVRECWVTPVDIQVDGEVYAAAGFVSHNSWIKGLEYAAAGIPFVAQRTAEYEALGAGLLASNGKEWRACLDRLRDPRERAVQRERGLEAARANDLRRRGREWEEAYAGLLAARPALAASQQ